jgi:hypothetical protein
MRWVTIVYQNYGTSMKNCNAISSKENWNLQRTYVA